MAEAMGLGKPVIATGYSGNLDFMTADNSYLVDYETGAVPEGCLPYPKGTPWAEPNLEQAAEYMRRVFEQPDEAAAKARQARQDILTKHNAAVAGAALAERVEKLRRTRIQVGRKHQTSIAACHAAAVHPRPTYSLGAIDGVIETEQFDSLFTPGRKWRQADRFAAQSCWPNGCCSRVLRPYWFQQRQAQATPDRACP